MRYLDYLTTTHRLAGGRVTDDLEVRDGRLWYRGLDLQALVERYGSPLEVDYLPVIGERLTAMTAAFEQAHAATGYRGRFVYAYASKANVTHHVVSAVLAAGAHYECSSAFDIDVARLMWRSGELPGSRLVLCNGFKIPAYAAKIIALHEDGFGAGNDGIMPVFDRPAELPLFSDVRRPLATGIRQRIDGSVTRVEDLDQVESRFGMSFGEAIELAGQIEATPNLELTLYHTMLGSQIEDEGQWVAGMRVAAQCWAELKQRHPTLRYLDFGGGAPATYRIGFQFDERRFARRITETVGAVCDEYGVDHPDLIGEFGRYAVADHGFHIFQVIAAKPAAAAGALWYLIDGSLMVSLPDIWALGQQFIILPLNGYDRPAQAVRLGGLTCDSDDEYRDRDHSDGLITLPALNDREPLYLGFFGTGAYQEMLSGVRGAHHCLIPEATELVIERAAGGDLAFRTVARQTEADVLRALGYPARAT